MTSTCRRCRRASARRRGGRDTRSGRTGGSRQKKRKERSKVVLWLTGWTRRSRWPDIIPAPSTTLCPKSGGQGGSRISIRLVGLDQQGVRATTSVGRRTSRRPVRAGSSRQDSSKVKAKVSLSAACASASPTRWIRWLAELAARRGGRGRVPGMGLLCSSTLRWSRLRG